MIKNARPIITITARNIPKTIINGLVMVFAS